MKPLCLSAALLLGGCSRSNNLFLGRVEAMVGSHRVVVTDCYRTRAPLPEKVSDTEYRYTPCRDADVRIRAEELTVNGQSYGHLNPRDGILVDHSVVSINRAE